MVSTSVQIPWTHWGRIGGKMFEKQGKYYADWRDRRGRRHRKSFGSKRAALKFEEEQREIEHPKIRAAEKPWQKSSSPYFRGKRPAAVTGKLPSESSLKLVRSGQRKSANLTLSPSVKRSKSLVSRTRQNGQDRTLYDVCSGGSGQTTAHRKLTTPSRVIRACVRETSRQRKTNGRPS